MKKRKKRTSKRPGGTLPDIKAWLRNKLRRISYQWPAMKLAVQQARVSRGQYRCAKCEGTTFGPKEIQRDHVVPVDDPHTGFTDWNNYIDRLFCSTDLIQILCLDCHQVKSSMEQEIRKQVRLEKKKEKK